MTFLYDNVSSPQRDRGLQSKRVVARFNWITPTATTATRLYYAKKSEFLHNGHRFTDSVGGSSSYLSLAPQLTAMGYTGGTSSYTGSGDYCYAAMETHKAVTVCSIRAPPTSTASAMAAETHQRDQPGELPTPAAQVKSFNFLFFTDAQEGADGSCAATLQDYTPFVNTLNPAVSDYPNAAFILSGGDQVNYVIDTWEWDAFFASGASVFAKYPFYMTIGNHECDGAGNDWAPGDSWTPVDQTDSEELGHFNPPQNGAAFYGGGTGRQPMTSGVDALEATAGNYYFIYGDTLFLVLDYQDSTLGTLTATEQNWVKSVVKQNPTRWRVAVLHKSLFGYRNTNPTTGTARKWTDAFDAAGIDLVLMGHDHLYVRTKYYSNGAVTSPQTPGSGTTYITGASANTDNRSDYYTPNAYTLVNSTGYYGQAYVDIAVSPSAIKVTTRGYQDGAVTTVEKNALITDMPRTPNLGSYLYPAAPIIKYGRCIAPPHSRLYRSGRGDASSPQRMPSCLSGRSVAPAARPVRRRVDQGSLGSRCLSVTPALRRHHHRMQEISGGRARRRRDGGHRSVPTRAWPVRAHA